VQRDLRPSDDDVEIHADSGLANPPVPTDQYQQADRPLRQFTAGPSAWLWWSWTLCPPLEAGNMSRSS
jgi:hypothetical protein